MRLYNLFPPLAGYFTRWEAHIERAADMGFDWIFVNPVQRPGQSRSLYSIADYFELNPILVDANAGVDPKQQLRHVVKFAEAKGMRMMVDLVINHCAVDSKLVRDHPEWFAREAHGGVTHPYCDEDGKRVVWRDLASFDHHHTSDPEGLFDYFLSITEFLMQLGFTGFRCDAAYQIPAHVWERLIGEIKRRNPDTLFVAETLGCTPDQTRQTAQAGFDYVFNSSKWWDFSSPWLMEQYNLVRESTPSISFSESHDTERLFNETHGNVEAVKQRYLFSAVFSAGVMMPMGYEYGFSRRLHVVETGPDDWEQPAVDLTEFVGDVNRMKAQHRAFQCDCPTEIIGYENPAILVMWKACVDTSEEVLVILNKDPWQHQHFFADRLDRYVQAGAPLVDVSPEYRMEYLPAPFSYDLRPGQGIVMATNRDF